MTSWKWGGARWWKCDLHTHTPASNDYGRGSRQAEFRQRSHRDWLLDYMRAGIDCVAVTDHNSGASIDGLKTALASLESDLPDGYRPLVLFPGVEISVNGGIHVLAILDPQGSTSDVDSLLGAVGFPSANKGSSDAVTSKTLPEVVHAIVATGGIAIPAHVDCETGLFHLTGTTLVQALDCRDIAAMEVVDPSFTPPPQYAEKRRRWTSMIGSDSHHPTGNSGQCYPGSRFSWIKMGAIPTIEGLRLALLDGDLSVRRSDLVSDDPNEHAASVIESIEISNAHYLGNGVGQPFSLTLNPWLNTVVGGRGTGKSTIVEFTRLALRRENDLPQELQEDFAKYSQVYPRDGEIALLRENAQLRICYRKDGTRYRIQWSPSGSLPPIEEEVEGTWRKSEGDVRQRFPVRIFSQKQIFHLANRPRALLGVIDEAPAVDRYAWDVQVQEAEAQILSLRAKAREIEAGLSEETRLRGELDDVMRKLAIFEESGHAELLKNFQLRQRQQRAVELWGKSWEDAGERLRQAARDLVPEPLANTEFDSASLSDTALMDEASRARDAISQLQSRLTELAADADKAVANWRAGRDASTWKVECRSAETAYQELRSRLQREGAGDPTAYGEMVQRRQTLEQRLRELEGRRKQVEELRTQASERLRKLQDLRRTLTTSRRDFLASVLGENRFVRITVVPYMAKDTVEQELRERLHRDGTAFEKDIEALITYLYGTGDNTTSAFEQRLAALKERLQRIATGSKTEVEDQRFANHVGKLNPEALDRIDLWFPEDSLKVEYSSTGDGRDFRPIAEGSPGQKTAALLAFLLSYGEEPLILDQPEDDLDNHLIYELIVTQLREVKRRRQIIVVTHNPNIVVNGDAELVIALVVRNGRTETEAEGSLQERHVRDTICAVMEGGREAFEQRYRRIALETDRVR